MRLRRRVAVVGVVALAGAGLGALGAPVAAQPVTASFDEVGSHEFVVPADVCEITVEASGAQGGGGFDGDDGFVPGGLGGRATATLVVTPDETLQINVGGAGEDGVDADGGPGGFNGGADGGGTDPDDTGPGGGGGGGASDVRQGGTGLDARVVVAGGGGGGGGAFGDSAETLGIGGGGGGLTGETGEAGDGTAVVPGGGGGGTQTAGGAGGTGLSPGTAGQLGEGGPGGSSDFSDGAGGGGGGGLFGGGGGGGTDNDAGGGGGGGSGFTPDGAGMDTGVNEGDGLVTLSYEVDPGCDLDPVEPVTPAAPVVTEPRFTG